MAPDGPCATFRQGGRAGPLMIDLLHCAIASKQRSLNLRPEQHAKMGPLECILWGNH